MIILHWSKTLVLTCSCFGKAFRDKISSSTFSLTDSLFIQNETNTSTQKGQRGNKNTFHNSQIEQK